MSSTCMTGRLAGGRAGARWLVVVAAVTGLSLAVAAAPPAQLEPRVSVTEEDGVYAVSARFAVTEAPSVVLETLTDYDRIPSFMPEVRTSRVLERGDDFAVVEQEAVARFLMFSRRVHLVLEVEEGRHGIRFRDRCGRSFSSYEGAWTVTAQDGFTLVTYELAARPSFDVPRFLLKRLFKRDASEMVERLKGEINSRASQT